MKKILLISFLSFLLSQDYSLRFYGDDYVDISTLSFSNTEYLNISIDVKLEQINDHKIIFDFENGPRYYLIAFPDQYVMRLEGFNEYVELPFSRENAADSNWHNISFQGTPNQVNLFYDGELVQSHPWNEPFYLNENSGSSIYANYIGAEGPSTSYFLNGYVDNLVVSTQSDVIAEWKCNTGSGSILYDDSGNQNHGTIYGAEWIQNTTLGDLNSDANIDILDIIILVQIIAFSGEYNELGDINGDGTLNILDAVALVQIVLGN